MNLDQACARIVTYSVVNGIESLSAVERMVKYFKLLSAEDQEAITVFMEETKVDA
jgi:hypothetical protein